MVFQASDRKLIKPVAAFWGVYLILVVTGYYELFKNILVRVQ